MFISWFTSIAVRLTGRQVSAGEEGIAVGSASALSADDVIFAQYRETGVFQQRGFTLKEFMSQLFANRNDHGKGRNMPVHYGGAKVKTVSCLPAKDSIQRLERWLTFMFMYKAYNLIYTSHSDSPRSRCSICFETQSTTGS